MTQPSRSGLTDTLIHDDEFNFTSCFLPLFVLFFFTQTSDDPNGELMKIGLISPFLSFGINVTQIWNYEYMC